MRVSRSDHDVCAKLVLRPGKPDLTARAELEIILFQDRLDV
jgi:hypothetical protein